MSKINDYISDKNNNGEKVLSVFLTSGYPNKESFPQLAIDILKAGADMLEIGFPFSDPLADGPIIQASSLAALENKINLAETLKYVREIKTLSSSDPETNSKPIILMGYANPVLNYGLGKFATEAKESGVDGIIIPDVPVEEYDNFYIPEFDGIDVILLVTPTTSGERIKQIDKKSKGFVYCVSVSGTTGNFNRKSTDNLDFIKNCYNNISVNKMLVGFGISKPEDAEQYAAFCDGVIVGSAVIKSLGNDSGNYNNTIELVKKLKAPLKKS
jgi:tryptophan synthase alpha chain